MARKRIDSAFDTESILKEAAIVRAELANLSSQITSFAPLRMKIEAAEGFKTLGVATKDLATKQGELASMTKLVEERIAKFNGTSPQIARQLVQQASATDKLAAAELKRAKQKEVEIRTEQRLAAERDKAGKKGNTQIVSTDNLAALEAERSLLLKTGVAVDDLNRAQAAAANSATQLKVNCSALSSTVKAAKIEEENLAKASRELKFANSDSNTQLQGFIIQKRLANEAAKQEALENLGLVDAYTRLNNEYKVAAQNAKNLAVQYGISSPAAKVAAAEAKNLNTQIQAIDKTVGQSNKNVGNYGSAFSKILGPFRQLANILPGIGIAGIIGAITGVLGDFINRIFKTSEAVDKLKLSQDNMNKALSDNSYKKAIQDVRQLGVQIDLAKQGFLDKERVLKLYNTTLGDSIGKAGSLDEAERLLTKNGEAYVQMTLFKAAANLAYGEAAQKAVEIQKKLFNRTPEENVDLRRSAFENASEEQTKEYNRLNKLAIDAVLNNSKNKAQLRKQADDYYESIVQQGADKNLKQEEKISLDIGDVFTKRMADISKKFKLNPFGDTKPTKEKKTKDVDAEGELFKQLQDDRKARFEILKQQLQDKIDTDEAILTDDRKTFQERLSAAKAFYDDSAAQTIALKNFELLEISKTGDEEIRKAGEQLKKKEISKAEFDKIVLSIEQTTETKRLQTRIKFNSEFLKLDRDNEKQLLDLKLKNEAELEAHRKSIHEQSLEDIQQQYDKDINAENASFAKKIAAARGNKKKIEKIEKDHDDFLLGRQLMYQIDSLSADIQFTKETIELAETRAKASGKQEDIDAVASAKQKLAALEIQLQKDVTDFTITSNGKIKKIE
jgi:hypothetical protein